MGASRLAPRFLGQAASAREAPRQSTPHLSVLSEEKSSFQALRSKSVQKITIESQDDDIPEISLFVFLILKMVDLATVPLISTAYYAVVDLATVPLISTAYYAGC